MVLHLSYNKIVFGATWMGKLTEHLGLATQTGHHLCQSVAFSVPHLVPHPISVSGFWSTVMVPFSASQ